MTSRRTQYRKSGKYPSTPFRVKIEDPDFFCFQGKCYQLNVVSTLVEKDSMKSIASELKIVCNLKTRRAKMGDQYSQSACAAVMERKEKPSI